MNHKISNVLKDFYLNSVREQLNTNVSPLLTKLNQTSTDVWGKNVIKLVKTGINGGFGTFNEKDKLPQSSSCEYEQLTLDLKNLYATFEISDKAIRASENSKGALINLLNAEMESLIQSVTINFGRMLYGDGKGILARIIDCKTNYIIVDNSKYLLEGMILDIYNSNKEKIYNSIRIVSIDKLKNKIYFNTNLNCEKDSFLTIQGSYENEITGLGAIFNKTGEIYGLKKDKHRFLIPYIKENVGNITEEIIQNAIDNIEEQSGNYINFIVCSYGVKRAFQKHLSSYRHNLDEMELNGGYKAISYNGIPIIADRFCPSGTMYLLNTNDFSINQLCDWEWLENGNGTILSQIYGKPVYYATLVKYANLLCDKPCGQGMLSGINEE